jgi:FkbM family methyltransferase
LQTLSKFWNLEFNSPLFRYILSFYYKPGRFYRIPFGPLKGIRIWYDRSVNYHAMLGLWERTNFLFLEKILVHLVRKRNKKLVVFDIGANIGLFSLFLRQFKENVSGVAFEPVPETFKVLTGNFERNLIDNVTPLPRAVGNYQGEVTFFVGHHHKSSLVRDWASDHGTTEINEIKVMSVTIDKMVENDSEKAPDIIKIDVEGGGDKVLKGAYHTLKTKRPILLFESHIPGEDHEVIHVLNEFDYKAFRLDTCQWVKNSKGDYKDRDGVWGTMLLFPEEKMSEFSTVL